MVVKQTVTIPGQAELLTFDFVVPNPGDGDWFTVHFGDQMLWSLLGQNFIGELMHATIPIEFLGGQTGDLYFTLHSVGERNAEILFWNMGFVGMPQASDSAVPEPHTLLLVIPGLLILCWFGARGKASRAQAGN